MRNIRNKIIFTAIVILVIVGALLFTSLSYKPAATANVFMTYLTSEPGLLDPAKASDVNAATVMAKLYNGLLRYDENMKLVTDLAESYEVSEDSTEFVFRLRPDIYFHNGQKLTAADVAYSFERILDPQTASSRVWVLERLLGAKEKLEGKADYTEGITALDDHTVILKLEEPFAPFLSLLAMPACYVLPSESAASIKNKTFFEKPAGTGPYILEDRVVDNYIKLKTNPAYFAQKPKVDGITIRIILENLRAEIDFERGALDLLQLYPSSYARFRANPKHASRINEIPALNVFYIGLNNQKPPFDNPKVRKALNMFIDRDLIIKELYSGTCTKAIGSIPPGVAGYSPEPNDIAYNPETGLKLLEEAGYNQDNPLKFTIHRRTSQSAAEITQLIQGELQKHGIVVEIQPIEWNAMKEAIEKSETQAFYLSWFGDYPDAENFLYPLFHSKNFGSGGNRAMFKDEEIDKALEEAVKENDETARNAMYSNINAKVADLAPWIYLWHTNETYVTSERVASMKFYPLFFCDKGLTVSLN